MPKQPIPKSIATPGLLSQIITSKYEDHLPLYQQEAMLKRIGIILPRATLSNWIFKSAERLCRLVDLLKTNIVTSNYAHADETTLNAISEQENRSQCYMWVFMAKHNGKYSVVYEYHPSRSAEVPNKFFEGFSGYLQSDGYADYNDLREKSEMTPLGSWAHVRRKFYEITKISKKSGSADVAMNFITKLYQVEKDAKDRGLNTNEIKNLRDEKSKPILDKFKAWLDKTITRAPPKSAIGQVLAYALNQWPTLITYCLDGNLQPDNNGPERMIKPFAYGRMNCHYQLSQRLISLTKG